jgi:hypothetical protein
MEHLLLILILILILAIFFYNCYLRENILEGVETSNKKTLMMNDTLEVGSFITSDNNSILFGLRPGTLGIYEIPGDTKADKYTDNEGLKQIFLKSTPKGPEVSIPGAFMLRLTPSGLVVYDSAINVIWSIAIPRLNEGSSLFIANNGDLKVTGGAIIDIEKGSVNESTGTTRTSFESILFSLKNKYDNMEEILNTFYVNVNTTALDNFRNKYNELFVESQDFEALQHAVYFMLQDMSAEQALGFQNACNIDNTYGNKSFCSQYNNDSYLINMDSVNRNEAINAYKEKYGDLLDLYRQMTTNNAGITTFLMEQFMAENIESFIMNVLQIGEAQALLYKTGVFKVLKTLYCSKQETFINQIASNYEPFSGNQCFSLL